MCACTTHNPNPKLYNVSVNNKIVDKKKALNKFVSINNTTLFLYPYFYSIIRTALSKDTLYINTVMFYMYYQYISKFNIHTNHLGIV